MIRKCPKNFIKRKIKIRKSLLRGKRNFCLTVFRSNKHIYGQIRDLRTGKTIFGMADSKVITKNNEKPKNKTEKARILGKEIAKEALAKGVKEVSFDRGGYKYHGRVKALAEGAREGGLIF